MACGLYAEDCIIEHWMPLLGGHREPSTWRAPCPLCDAEREPLSIWIRARRIEWRNHCRCERAKVHARLAELLPGCVTVRYSPKRAVDRDELIAIALDKSLPPNALRVAVLQALGMPTPEIRAKLGLPKQSWSDVVRILGQNHRSA